MYISRFVLNVRSRNARSWLADCHALHRVIMSGFPSVESEAARAALGVLYRVEPMSEPPGIPVLVQASVEPRWTLASEAITEIEKPKSLEGLINGIQNGGRYRFRLRANPSRRVHRRATLELDTKSTRTRTEEAGSIGKRVELIAEGEQIEWLKRRGDAAGFSLVATRLEPAQDVLALQLASRGRIEGRRQGRQLTLGTVLFEGELQVTDAGRFRDAIATGIGPAKSFGCGLLSIAPILRRLK